MTKNEAISAMSDGYKVRHRFFSSEEWIKKENNLYVFEDGVKVSPCEFWSLRNTPYWEEGWSIIKE